MPYLEKNLFVSMIEIFHFRIIDILKINALLTPSMEKSGEHEV